MDDERAKPSLKPMSQNRTRAAIDITNRCTGNANIE